MFYGEKAIDRSPCGTGNLGPHGPARRDRPAEGRDDFVHESIIGSLFRGRVEAEARVGDHSAIVRRSAAWARTTGLNTIFIDDRDPFAHGFVVT